MVQLLRPQVQVQENPFLKFFKNKKEVRHYEREKIVYKPEWIDLVSLVWTWAVYIYEPFLPATSSYTCCCCHIAYGGDKQCGG